MIGVGDPPVRLASSHLPASLLASAAMHAIGLALAARLVGGIAMPGDAPRAILIPVSLVSLPGGGGGQRSEGPPAAAPAPAAAPPSPPPAPAREPAVKPAAPKPRPVVARKPAPARTQPASEPAAPPPLARASPAAAGVAGGADVSGGAGDVRAGGGDGTGGDGSGGARPAYGSNPRPPYPLAARRLGQEGRVLLEVVVRPDGRPASVRVRQSSGHAGLDRSAVETVRTRWRFIPARRDGAPVESTVTVPIRFRLDRG